MVKHQIKRCCGNCEWSISPTDEDEIMRENHYEEDDSTRPRVGDCCLGMEHDDKYVCKEHQYISGGLKNYVLYDDEYLGVGYYVISEYYNDIIKYFKLYRTGTYGNYSYGIRTYEIEPIISDGNRKIIFDFNEIDNKNLYQLFSIFAKELDNNVIECKESIITTKVYGRSVVVNFSKVINDTKKDNGFIDIIVKCDREDKNYELIEHLFRNLEVATMNMNNENSVKKVRKK